MVVSILSSKIWVELTMMIMMIHAFWGLTMILGRFCLLDVEVWGTVLEWEPWQHIQTDYIEKQKEEMEAKLSVER